MILAVARTWMIAVVVAASVLACTSSPGQNGSQNTGPASTSAAPTTGAAPADTRSALPSVPAGVDVEFVQVLLEVAGFGPLAYDGVFGPRSSAATSAFQRSVGLPEIGVVDDATWARLLSTTTEDTYVTTCEETGSRPTSFTFCDDAPMYQNFTWDEWSPLGARGRGVLVTTCLSLCDNGEPTVESQIEMELGGAQPLQCGDAPPWLEFTTVTINEDGLAPYSFTLEGPFC